MWHVEYNRFVRLVMIHVLFSSLVRFDCKLSQVKAQAAAV